MWFLLRISHDLAVKKLAGAKVTWLVWNSKITVHSHGFGRSTQFLTTWPSTGFTEYLHDTVVIQERKTGVARSFATEPQKSQRHFCPVLLVTQTCPNTMWERTPQGHAGQEVGTTLLGLQFGHRQSDSRVPETVSCHLSVILTKCADSPLRTGNSRSSAFAGHNSARVPLVGVSVSTRLCSCC